MGQQDQLLKLGTEVTGTRGMIEKVLIRHWSLDISLPKPTECSNWTGLMRQYSAGLLPSWLVAICLWLETRKHGNLSAKSSAEFIPALRLNWAPI